MIQIHLGLIRLIPLGIAIFGCNANGTPKPQTVVDIKAIEADVFELIPVGCAVATALDPGGAIIVCAVIDAAENVLKSVTLVCPSTAIASAMVAAHPASVTLTPKLLPLASMTNAHYYGVKISK
jgi:hypothetical protein